MIFFEIEIERERVAVGRGVRAEGEREGGREGGRERGREGRREGERERGRERIPSRLCTVNSEPDAGIELTNC